MAHAVTTEEIERLIKVIDAFGERLKNDPEEARRVLCEAGIYTADGKLTKPYRKYTPRKVQ